PGASESGPGPGGGVCPGRREEGEGRRRRAERRCAAARLQRSRWGRSPRRGRKRVARLPATAPAPARRPGKPPGAFRLRGPARGTDRRRCTPRTDVGHDVGGSSVDLDKGEKLEAELAAAALDTRLNGANRAVQQGSNLFLLKTLNIVEDDGHPQWLRQAGDGAPQQAAQFFV